MKKIVTLLFALATVIIPMWGQQFPEPKKEHTTSNASSKKDTYESPDETYAYVYNLYTDDNGNEYLGFSIDYIENIENFIVKVPKTYLFKGTKELPVLRLKAFNDCLSNFSLDLSASDIVIIDDYCANGITTLTGTLNIPSSVTYIGNSAFYDCKNIQTLVFNEDYNNELTIGYQAFRKCLGLNGELKIPGRVKRIENAAFRGCSALSTIIISEGVEEIGAEAFAYCGTITDDDVEETPTQPIQRLELPHTLKTIGSEYIYGTEMKTGNANAAFYNTDIKEVHISLNNNNDIPQMIIGSGDDVQQFSEYTVNNTVFYIPCNTKEYFMAQKGWKDIKNYLSEERGVVRFVVEPEDAAYPSVDWSCNSSDEIYHITLNKQTTDVFLGWYINGTKITSDEDFDFNVKDNEQYLNEDNEYIFTAKFGSVSTAWRWDADAVYVIDKGEGNSSEYGNNITKYQGYDKQSKTINVTLGDGSEMLLTVPVLVEGNKTLSELTIDDNTNIVIFDGGKLTIDKSATLASITVNEGGVLVVNQGLYATNELVLWNNPYTGKTAEILGLRNVRSENVYFDCLLKDQYTSISFPTDIKFNNITYAYDYLDSDVVLGADRYNGATAAKGENGWEYDITDNTNNYKFEMGRGYCMWTDKPDGEYYRIRFLFESNFDNNPKTFQLNVNANTEDIETANWNFIGTLATTSLTKDQGCDLFNFANNYYVTNDFISYDLKDDLKSSTLTPYKGYIVQVDGTSSFLSYNETQTSILKAPNSIQEYTEEYRTGIILDQAQNSDRAVLIVGEQFTPAYDLGNDLAKLFTGREDLTTYTLLNSTPLAVNATTPELAQLSMPLGFRTVNTDSPLTFSLDSRYNADNISALYLHDNITNTTVNLLAEDYTFTTDLTQDDSRFTLALITQANEDVATALPQNTDNPLYAYAADGTLLVAGFSESADVSVFDISGRLITNANGCNTTARFSLPAGHYIVNVKQGAQTTILRAIVH